MRIVVLISGSGTNLQALIDACEDDTIDGEIVHVVSNRKAAYGLTRAEAAGIATSYRPFRRASDDRHQYDAHLADHIAAQRPDLIVLAGWMHILDAVFLDRFLGRVINLHPALPGQFPGKQAVADAWAAWQAGKIRHTGVMVHTVVPEIDAGPVLATAVVPIGAHDTFEGLLARVHHTEHVLLVNTIAQWALPESD
ncbi:MAG: phosphoribosylglycinamide formyltransferase-1 [Bradymonadia bacterium]|jgi:phosphoribosylglycinamide formyltransferase-1